MGKKKKPTYEELAQALEEMLASTANFDEMVKPDPEEWARAYKIWKRSGVTPLYYHDYAI